MNESEQTTRQALHESVVCGGGEGQGGRKTTLEE